MSHSGLFVAYSSTAAMPCDCVTFPVPLIRPTAFIVNVDDTWTCRGGRAVKRDSET